MNLKKGEKDWKNIFKNDIAKNKIYLIDYINNLIVNKYKTNYIMKENDIKHIVLVESAQISDEELIEKLPKKQKDKYDKANEQEKMNILELVKIGLDIHEDEVRDFFEEEKLGILNKKELIERLKEILPFQYHSALLKIE